MTRAEMWEEFESQLKKEIHTPITMSYDDSIRLAELGIEETVAKWKPRLEQEPCEDCISREKTCDYIAEFINHEFSTQSECEMVDAMIEGIQHFPSVKQESNTDYKAFAEWVASEIFSEDWEFNKDSFEEIACRKLSKLGIVVIGPVGPVGPSVWKLKEGED